MRLRWKVRVSIVLLIGVLALSSPLRVKLLGLLRREPFYGGWPASYWSGEVRAYAPPRWGKPAPPPTQLQQLLARVGFHQDGKPRVLEGGAAAVPVLAVLVGDEDVLVRREAVMMLAKAGPSALIAIPVLREAFADPDRGVRQGAVRAVGASGVGSGDREALVALIAALETEDPALKIDALAALERYGRAARPAMPVICGLLLDPADYTRFHALRALGAIGPDGAAAIPTILEAMRHEREPYALEEAVFALGEMNAKPKDMIAMVVSWLRLRKPPPSDQVRAGGPPAGPAGGSWFHRGNEAALPVLVRALEEGDHELRATSAWALGQLREDAKPATAALVKALKDENAEVRRQATSALKDINPETAGKPSQP